MTNFNKRRARPAPADVPRLLADINENARSWPTQLRQWVRSALYYTEEVIRTGADSTPASRAMSWVRVYASLTDLREVFEAKEQLLEEMNQYPGGEAVLVLLGLTREVLERIEAVRCELSEDELVYFWYRRQVEVHPFQDGVRLRVTQSGAVSDRRKVDLLRRECAVEELNAAIRRVLVRYGNEETIAVDCARRVYSPLQAMAVACDRYLEGPA